MLKPKEDYLIAVVRRLLNGISRFAPARAGRIGYRFLAKPRRPAVDQEGRRFLAAAEAKKLALVGESIQVYRWPGAGPGVLLLHGWESSSARWAPYWPALREAGFDLYAVDAPAQGGSSGQEFSAMAYARAVGAYLEQLDDPPTYWLGHSAGGMAALYYLGDMHGKVRPERLIIMGVAGELRHFVDKFCEVVGLNDTVHTAIEREFKRRFGLGFSGISFVRMAKALEMPGLIIHDYEDDLAPFSGAEEIHRNWPQSRLLPTHGRTHSVLGRDLPAQVVNFFENRPLPDELLAMDD